jgi:5-(carboxyamino)imidazole ribonucleotide synthase
MMVGVLGGGQLARMLALAGYPLGLRFVFLDPAGDACAFALGEALHGGYDDCELLERLASRAGVVTYEFENVPAQTSRFLSERVQVYPPWEALAVTQDRLAEKRLFRELDIPTSPFHPVDTRHGLHQALGRLGLPLVLKTRSGGYDGKGQLLLANEEDIAPAWDRLGGSPLLAEQYVPFVREVSMIAVRGQRGETAYYPMSENVHRAGMLHMACSRPGDPMAGLATEYVGRVLSRFDYVGVLALEFFQEGDRLLANEFAPRVHNSGHWTIEGAETSQFENHLRAILGLPLGSTSAVGSVAMVNCIGTLPDTRPLLALADVHLHVYDKLARPGRKLGHVTVRAHDSRTLQTKLSTVCELLNC